MILTAFLQVIEVKKALKDAGFLDGRFIGNLLFFYTDFWKLIGWSSRAPPPRR